MYRPEPRVAMKTQWIGDVLSGSLNQKEVHLKGWIHRSRGSNAIRFVVLRDSTELLQCVVKRGRWDASRGSRLCAYRVQPRDQRNGHTYRQGAWVRDPSDRSQSHWASGPLEPFPITESAMEEADGGETEFLLDNRTLPEDTKDDHDVENQIIGFGAIHSFFRDRLHRIPSPQLVAGAVEGVAPCLRSRISEGRPISLSLGNSTQRPPCPHSNDSTPSHHHSGPKRVGQGGT